MFMYLYIVICTCFLAVSFVMYICVHSTWTDTTVAAPFFVQEMGTQKVPFYAALRGLLHLDVWTRTRAGGKPFRTQGPPCKNFLYIFTHDHLWLVIVILKSQSRRLQHSCIVLFVLAYVLCFLGALARGLFL